MVKLNNYLVRIVNINTNKINKEILISSYLDIDTLNNYLNIGRELPEVDYIYSFLRNNEGYEDIFKIKKVKVDYDN